MFKDTPAFSGFSVSDLAAAKEFYGNTLGLDVKEIPEGLQLNIADSNPIFVYPKPNHTPASFTILNFPVTDIKSAVAALKEAGITFETYEGMTDADGIAWGKEAGRGPDIAWFKDPAGNTLAVLNG